MRLPLLIMAVVLAAAMGGAQSGQGSNPQYQDGYDDGYGDGYADGSNDGYAQGYQDAYDAGFRNGQASGYDNGYANGSADGYARGYQDAYADGFGDGRAVGAAEGYDDGYADGYRDGATEAYVQGFNDGHSAGYANGSADGYAVGYAEGRSEGYAQGFDAGFAAGFDQGYTQGSQNGTGAPLDTQPKRPHPAMACSVPYHIQWAGWDLCWQQDDLRVQGLEINRAFFHNDSVVWKMGVPFSITQYESPLGPGPFKDTLGRPGDAGLFGYGGGSMVIDQDACPRFYAHAELINGGRVCVEHREGPDPAVALWARYDIVNYRFIQGWVFDSRGHIEPLVILGGHLIDGATIGSGGQDHYHHIYWRIDFDIATDGNDLFQSYMHGSDRVIGFNQHPAIEQIAGQIVEGAGTGDCAQNGFSATLWCDIRREARLDQRRQTIDKWRVVDTEDTNARGNARSFEFFLHSDAPVSRFSTFDVMAVEYRGDSDEIGHEVATNPNLGDEAVVRYSVPPDAIVDPVVWAVHHAHHDTRDEDSGSMSHHHIRFDMRPHNFVAANPGEDTFP